MDMPKDEDCYEQEQIQQILINESEKQKILMDRELRETQEREYQESLKEDIRKTIKFDEPSVEEMRRIRLNKFSN
tara:strand:- start:298 stop:522 length:225 start_codon:yes stop_codon:yes gene_type:complete